jgi:apolipoprotein D and lipocalin family protein
MRPLLILAWLGLSAGSAAVAAPRVVPALDLERYLGTWYEVARYPNRFQAQCVGEVTAQYARRDDGRLSVVNRCRTRDGHFDQAEGVARVPDPGSPAKLQVRFAPGFLSFLHKVWGDYWVLALGPGYRYAVVGDPKREYLWILSRTPQLSPEDYDAAVSAARSNGFDAARLVHTPQPGG